MYTIGEFAAYGQVSVRMLRHYDAIGLLEPAHVDERSGYRFYAVGQMPWLLRIVELRSLGCGLDDAAIVLSATDEDTALRDVLTRRRDELRASLAQDAARLARIDERLRILKGSSTMSASPIEYRSIEPVTVLATSGVAPGPGPENVTPVVEPLIGSLLGALHAAHADFREPGIFWYDSVEDSDDLAVHVSWVAGPDAAPGDGYDIIHLPAVEKAAVLTHYGEVSAIGDSYAQLMEGLVRDGYQMVGACREVYLKAEPDIPQSEWITELQQPVVRA